MARTAAKEVDDWITPSADGEDDWISPEVAPSRSSATGAFARGAERGALPAAGGLAGFAAGAEAGAAAGAFTGPAAPVAVPALGFVGGMVGAYGGATAVDAAQRWVLDHAPDGVAKALGLDKEQEQADVEEHPIASFAGNLAPNLALIRPGAVAKAVEDGAPAIEKLLSNPITARAVPAAIMGTQEAATEGLEGEPLDPTKIALAAGTGALSNQETALGRRIGRAGAAPVEAVRNRFQKTLSDATPADAAAPVLAADSVDDAITAAQEQVDRAPVDIDAMAETARQQAEAVGKDSLHTAEPAADADWQPLHDEAGAVIGQYNAKTEEIRLASEEPSFTTTPGAIAAEHAAEVSSLEAEGTRQAAAGLPRAVEPAETLPIPGETAEIEPIAARQPSIEPAAPEPQQIGRLRGVQRRLGEGPIDAATFLAMKGGIRNDEGHDLTYGRGLQQFVPGIGPLIRPKGLSIDVAGEALWDAGYFGNPDHTPRPSENDVLQFLEGTRRGTDNRPTKVFARDDAAKLATEAEGKRATEDNARALQDVHDHAKAFGEVLTPEEADRIVGVMGERGIDPESAVVEHIERKAIQEVQSDHEQTGDTEYASAVPERAGAGSADLGVGEGVEGPTPVHEGPVAADEARPAAAPDTEQAHELTTERGADGLPQTLIAGAEHSARQLAKAREDHGHGRIRAARAQQDAGGMFAPKLEETRDIFDQPARPAPPDAAPVEPRAPKAITLPEYDAAAKRFRAGDMTAAEANQHFEDLAASKDSILAELRAYPKDHLAKMDPRNRNESKAKLADSIYSSMLNSFNAKGTYSWSPFGAGGTDSGPTNGIRKAMESQTDQHIKEYAEARKQRLAERQQTYTDPQTVSQFRDFIHVRGADKLTNEQKARYDAMVADETRGQADREKAQNQTVKGVDLGAVTAKVIETKHTQKGHDLFVVQLSERVEKDTYNRLNEAAHKLGGRYSSYAKEGAVPGFQFRSREAADKFVALKEGDVSKADLTTKRETEVKENAVERLRGMADRMTDDADESLNADRKVNTARRANQAAGAEAQAQANKAMATTMRNLADAIEGGDVRYLDAIRTRSDVETLSTLARRAQIEWARAEQKRDPNLRFEKLTEGPVTPEMIDKAPYPWPNAHRETALDLAGIVENKPGFKRDTIALRKMAEDAGRRGDWLVRAENLQTQGILHSIAQEVGKGQFSYRAGDVLDSFKDYGRLQRMGMSNPPTMRAALREFLQYRGSAAKADPIKAAERALIGNKIPGYFPTPPRVVDRLIDLADIRDGMKVLEPSAGKGNILDRLPDAAKNLDIAAIEPHSSLRDILQMKGANIVDRDFLPHEGAYDRIVMNPPFENGQDIDHVRHAFDLLKPEGRVTAIMSEGPFYREDAKAREFRDWLEKVGGTSEKLPEGSFMDSERSTGVATRLVVIDKGAGEQPMFSRPEGPDIRHGRVTGTFTPQFDAMRDTVGKELRARLDKMGLHDIALKLPDAITVTTPEGQTKVTGAYAKKIIAVALEAGPDNAAHEAIMDHEAVHAAQALGLFNKSEWSILSNRAVRDWREKFQIDKRYPDLPEEKRNEEAIAEAFRHWVEDRGTQKGTLASIFDKLRNALAAIGNVFRGHGFETADSIFRKFSEGEIGARERAGAGNEDTSFSRDGKAANDEEGVPSLQNRRYYAEMEALQEKIEVAQRNYDAAKAVRRAERASGKRAQEGPNWDRVLQTSWALQHAKADLAVYQHRAGSPLHDFAGLAGKRNESLFGPGDEDARFQVRENGEDAGAVPMRAVYIKSTGKVEFRPVEKPAPKSAASEPAPTASKGTSLRAIEGTGEERERAINHAIYNVGEEAPQLKAAERLVNSNFPDAVAIAMRRKNPPPGLHPEFVYMAVEAKAIGENNTELMRKLSQSKIAEEATTMGQRIAAWRNRAEISPVDDMRRIQEARAAKLKDRGVNADKAVDKMVDEAVQQIKKDAKSSKRPSWNDFLLSIVCPS